jgi:hypothetical protein
MRTYRRPPGVAAHAAIERVRRNPATVIPHAFFTALNVIAYLRIATLLYSNRLAGRAPCYIVKFARVIGWPGVRAGTD